MSRLSFPHSLWCVFVSAKLRLRTIDFCDFCKFSVFFFWFFFFFWVISKFCFTLRSFARNLLRGSQEILSRWPPVVTSLFKSHTVAPVYIDYLLNIVYAGFSIFLFRVGMTWILIRLSLRKSVCKRCLLWETRPEHFSSFAELLEHTLCGSDGNLPA